MFKTRIRGSRRFLMFLPLIILILIMCLFIFSKSQSNKIITQTEIEYKNISEVVPIFSQNTKEVDLYTKNYEVGIL
jgi:hypothetical protein